MTEHVMGTGLDDVTAAGQTGVAVVDGPSATGLDGVTFAGKTTENSLLPQYFTPPKINPAPGGLWVSTYWTEETGAPRWLSEGVQFLSAVTGNYSGELSAGVWGADWCGEPGSGSGAGDLKTGVRPGDPLPFYPVTVWAYDACDMTAASRAEVAARAQQVLRMREGVLSARQFAARLVEDVPSPVPVDDLTEAVGELETMFAEANVLGVIHCSPFLLPHLTSHVLVARGGMGGYATASGHTVVVDGGYAHTLGDDLMVATSALYGWRVPVEVREAVDFEHNTYAVVAERSSVIGYEQVLGGVTVAEVGS